MEDWVWVIMKAEALLRLLILFLSLSSIRSPVDICTLLCLIKVEEFTLLDMETTDSLVMGTRSNSADH